MVADSHTGDIGTVFEITITEADGVTPVDISAVTTKEICFRKPGGDIITRAASFLTDGTNGVLTYTTIANDLDVDGGWTIQAHVIFADGKEFRSELAFFTVEPNICP